mmetsp:Transcript_29571/g.83399  ORF Transcript_29571/g.83399 Transcript_29571/m.83399 type:complete len:200 (+) Transcript_29571:77-676(+)
MLLSGWVLRFAFGPRARTTALRSLSIASLLFPLPSDLCACCRDAGLVCTLPLVASYYPKSAVICTDIHLDGHRLLCGRGVALGSGLRHCCQGYVGLCHDPQGPFRSQAPPRAIQQLSHNSEVVVGPMVDWGVADNPMVASNLGPGLLSCHLQRPPSVRAKHSRGSWDVELGCRDCQCIGIDGIHGEAGLPGQQGGCDTT